MKLPKNWMSYFESRIVSRGKEYFDEGLVKNIKSKEDIITASVLGNDTYFVQLYYHNDEFMMSCTCPHADDGNNCKHMAALCFAAEKIEKERSVMSQKSGKILLDDASEADIRGFLRSLLESSPDIASKFQVWMQRQISDEQMKEYQKQITSIVRKAMSTYMEEDQYYDEYGYTSSLYDIFSELRDFVDSVILLLIRRGFLKEAFSLIQSGKNAADLLIDKFPYGDADSFDNAKFEVYEILYPLLSKLLEQNCPEDLRKDIFNWLCNDAEKTDDIIYISKDNTTHTWKILTQYFTSKEEVKEMLTLAKRLLDDEDLDFPDSILKTIFQLMEKLNPSSDEITEFENQHSDSRVVLEQRINRACKKKNYKEAAAVQETYLLNHLKIYPNKYEYANDLRRLSEFYKKAGDTKSCKKYLVMLLREYQMSMHDFREYRTLFSPDEWIEEREKILTIIHMNHVKEILYEEKLYDRLMDKFGKNSVVDEMQKYEKELGKRYPKRVAELYCAEAQYLMEEQKANTRQQYKYIAYVLKCADKYPEGKEMIHDILNKWDAAYKRRIALWDEIRKAKLH
ncbi:MAG TPA: SWIM zinc finger family protein [Methanocorpusculum sp.]|nr:SWIM zinc finger family protein [Methanocorpusculum sp.]